MRSSIIPDRLEVTFSIPSDRNALAADSGNIFVYPRSKHDLIDNEIFNKILARPRPPRAALPPRRRLRSSRRLRLPRFNMHVCTFCPRVRLVHAVNISIPRAKGVVYGGSGVRRCAELGLPGNCPNRIRVFRRPPSRRNDEKCAVRR